MCTYEINLLEPWEMPGVRSLSSKQYKVIDKVSLVCLVYGEKDALHIKRQRAEITNWFQI